MKTFDIVALLVLCCAVVIGLSAAHPNRVRDSGVDPESSLGPFRHSDDQSRGSLEILQDNNPDIVLADQNRFNGAQLSVIKELKTVLPSGALVRDYVAISDHGTLVLYVENPVLSGFPGEDTDGDGKLNEQTYSCPDDYYGQQLQGDYYLGLVRNGELVSKSELPASEYSPNRPMLRYFRGVIEGTWHDNGHPTEADKEIIEPQLLRLEDLNGDGLEHEVSFKVGYLSCGNNAYTIGGYNQRSDRVVFYPVRAGGTYSYTHHNFFPSSDGSVEYRSGCDHSAEQEEVSQFVFNPDLEEYVLRSYRMAPCY